MNISEVITQGVARATAPPSAVSTRRRVATPAPTAAPAPSATPNVDPKLEPKRNPKPRGVTDAFAARRTASVRADSRLKIDEGTQRAVTEILNDRNEIIRQVPAEELLRIGARLRNVVGKLFDQSA